MHSFSVLYISWSGFIEFRPNFVSRPGKMVKISPKIDTFSYKEPQNDSDGR